MSFYTDASLVMIPSGYKDQKVYCAKPVDGSADLTFSRASNATRVNSSGLVERVRENLILQSNSFDTTWISDGGLGSTVTSGQADPDGGTSAWLFAKLSETGRREQIITMAANEQTFSIVAKKGTSNFLYVAVFDGTTTHSSYFNLDTGAVGTQLNAVASMVSVGSGWYRCSLTSTNANATGVIQLYISDANGAVYGTTGNIYIYQSQFENGVATDYIATTSAAVSVGPVSGLPRLDYSGGASCPSLLLEPQRTNLFTYSEQFDNAAWNKSSTTITANSVSSPDGYSNADTITASGSGVITHRINRLVTTTSGSVYAFSVFAKKGNTDFIALRHDNGGTFNYFNINTGTKGATCDASATIQNYGNGWYRCTVFHTATVINGGEIYLATANGVVSFEAAGEFAYLYGAQYELGSYASSYIPTLSSAVTRVADAASKTGIGSLIGGTSGTIFYEIHTNPNMSNASYKQLFYYIDASALQGYAFVDGANVIKTNANLGNMTASIVLAQDTTYKIAIAYAPSDFKLYVNGAEVASSTSGTPKDFVDILSIGSYAGASEWNEFGFKQILHFKTRLSNADLARLTSL